MLKNYKYRLCPTRQQVESINKNIDACRFIYNLALETKQLAYKGNKINIKIYDLIRQLPELKKECMWLKEVYNHSLQYSILNLEKTYNNFFKHHQRFPKFKKRYGKQSYTLPTYKFKIDFDNELLYIPKVGKVRTVFDREFKEQPKSATISKSPTNKYYISFLIDDNKEFPIKPEINKETTIGIDLGIKYFAVLSNGTKIENPRYLRESINRLKILQYRVSKKQKGSVNRKKANLKVAKVHEKIANRRMDFLHKLTTQLTRENQADTICVENLAVSNLIKNHKLAQSISDVSWSKFIELLSYKCDWYGKNLIKIGRFEPSSKMCNECGWIKRDLKLSDREWVCENCGCIHDRDINAAINIRNTGTGCSVEPVESSTVVGAEKQEKINCLTFNI